MWLLSKELRELVRRRIHANNFQNGLLLFVLYTTDCFGAFQFHGKIYWDIYGFFRGDNHWYTVMFTSNMMVDKTARKRKEIF